MGMLFKALSYLTQIIGAPRHEKRYLPSLYER